MSVYCPHLGTQVRYLFLSTFPEVSTLKDKFISKFICGTKLRDSPKLASAFVMEIYAILEDPGLMEGYKNQDVLEDDVIFHRLCTFYHAEIAKDKVFESAKTKVIEPASSKVRESERNITPPPKKGWTREDNRLKVVAPLIEHYTDSIGSEKKEICYLDIGCNEGAITKALGDFFSAQSIDGCDVFDAQTPGRDFNFYLLQDSEKYTLTHYQDLSKDVISAFMALHHIEEIRVELEAVGRILKNDGIFLIREHDLNSENLCVVLDLMHAFYDFVWKVPPKEDGKVLPTFRNHFARYYSQTAMRELIEGCGFKEVCRSSPVGMWRYYHAVFVKKTFWEESQSQIRRRFPGAKSQHLRK